MPCYHPLTAYQCANGDVVFQELRGRDTVRSLQLPCGQCIGCRLERSRQWAVRCVHEASLYERNCFVTLTYNEDALPDNAGLRYRDFQLFMKRLRKNGPSKMVRFFMCGEYGENFGRPHFHACLFNVDFPDKVFLFEASSGGRVYRSACLERFWPHGFSSLGDVTFQSVAYVARYVMKKVTGEDAQEHYGRRRPEFCQMSRRPGIGARWLAKFMTDVYPSGKVVINGTPTNAPRFYNRRYKKLDDDAWAVLCANRDAEARKHYLDNTEPRLAVKEKVTAARISFLKRSL